MEVRVLRVAHCVCRAEELELLVVNGLDMHIEVVLPVEDAVAAESRARVSRLLRWVSVDGLEVTLETVVVFQPEIADGANWWMDFARMSL
jgi:hypothetical protein